MSDLNVDEIRNATGSGAPSFPQGISIDPTTMSDADATKIGLKVYSVAGGDFTITDAGSTALSSVSYGIAIPYQLQDASWRLRLQLKINLTSSQTVGLVSLSGIDHTAFGTDRQALAVESNSITGDSAYTFPTGTNSGPTVLRFQLDSAQTRIVMSGDIALDAKPTWAV